METAKLNTQEMREINGGQYFKPCIDGSWLANERSLRLKHARSMASKEKTSFKK